MSVTVSRNPEGQLTLLTGGLMITLDEATAERIVDFVTPVEKAPSDGMLEENHPMWDHHSGGDRHEGVGWSLPEALEDARKTRRHLADLKAKAFFDLLLSDPGRLFSSDELVALLPNHFNSPAAVAGCLNGFVKPCREFRRPFPFYWWEGADGKPTRYSVRPSVAKVFNAAGE